MILGRSSDDGPSFGLSKLRLGLVNVAGCGTYG
jgi:hypothetical protein